MNSRGHWKRRFAARLLGPIFGDHAAQIAEFALSLPLLVVFVVGIFDFSGALALKQKLSNAVREGARVAAADPASDLSNTSALPISIQDTFYVVDSYLTNAKIDDCGLGAARPTKSPNSLTWVSTASGCVTPSPKSLILTINRGFKATETLGDITQDVIHTQVEIQYPYKWRFNNVIGLLVPGTSYAGVSYITTSAYAFNEN